MQNEENELAFIERSSPRGAHPTNVIRTEPVVEPADPGHWNQTETGQKPGNKPDQKTG